jgi:hypothetical protein
MAQGFDVRPRDDLTNQLYLVGALEHVFFPIPSGYVKIAIENGHRNSGFSH